MRHDTAYPRLLYRVAREQRQRALVHKLALEELVREAIAMRPSRTISDHLYDLLDAANTDLRSAMIAEEQLTDAAA